MFKNKTLKIFVLLFLTTITASHSIQNYCEFLSDEKGDEFYNTYIKSKKENAAGGMGRVYFLEDGSALKYVRVASDDTSFLENEVRTLKNVQGKYGLLQMSNCFFYEMTDNKNNTWVKVFIFMDKYNKGDLSEFIKKTHYYKEYLKLLEQKSWERDQIIKNHKNEDYIKKDNISNTLIWRYDMALKIAYGIRNLHSLGIGHYDLKPQNIFMMNSFTPIIGDFGLSKPFTDRMDSTAGTMYYLAPEAQYRIYNDKTDIYALGYSFLQLFKGTHKYIENFGIFKSSNSLWKIFGNMCSRMTLQEPEFDFNNLLPQIEKGLIARGQDPTNESELDQKIVDEVSQEIIEKNTKAIIAYKQRLKAKMEKRLSIDQVISILEKKSKLLYKVLKTANENPENSKKPDFLSFENYWKREENAINISKDIIILKNKEFLLQDLEERKSRIMNIINGQDEQEIEEIKIIDDNEVETGGIRLRKGDLGRKGQFKKRILLRI